MNSAAGLPLPPDLPTTDADWARYYPSNLRAAAELHFSPISVVRLAAEWLCATSLSAGGFSYGDLKISQNPPPASYVDLGSGTGKFCLIAAAHQAQAHWLGIETRPSLIAEAERRRQHYALSNCSFRCEDIRNIDLSSFVGAYLFNPFLEQLDAKSELGTGLQLGREAYRSSCAALRQRLDQTAPGFRLVTYFCHGLEIPASFQQQWEAEDGKLLGLIKA